MSETTAPRGVGVELTEDSTPAVPPVKPGLEKEVLVDGHPFLAKFQLSDPESTKYGDSPSFADQEVSAPQTVIIRDTVVEVFDLSVDADRIKLAALIEKFGNGERICQDYFNMNPDPLRLNFRVRVIHAKKRYLKVQPKK